MQTFFQLIERIDNLLWGTVTPIVVLGFGLYASVRLRFPWARYFRRMFSGMNIKAGENSASPFEGLCMLLGGQVGTGNIIGVATSLAAGGPGALLWMMLTAFAGMSTALVENVLVQLYKRRTSDGSYTGGSIYYMRYGLGSRLMAGFMAVSIAFGSAMADCAGHISAITGAIDQLVPCSRTFIGLLLSLSAAFIVYGGLKRTVSAAKALVPLMATAYLLLSLFIIISHLNLLPSVFALILQSAFSFRAVGGGILGYAAMRTLRYGVARGVFSNEAGMGTTSLSGVNVEAAHPVSQGIIGMCGVLVDTLLICTATGIVILLSGVDTAGSTGWDLVLQAFSAFTGNVAPVYLTLTLSIFGFTSIFISYYYGRIAIRYLFGERRAPQIIYLALEVLISSWGATVSMERAFLFIDFMNCVMCMTNIIAMFLLFDRVKCSVDDYDQNFVGSNSSPDEDGLDS